MTSVAHLGSDHLGPLPRVVHPGEGRGLRQLKLLHHQGLLWQGEQCAKSQSNPLLYAHGSGLLHPLYKLPLSENMITILMFAVFIDHE